MKLTGRVETGTDAMLETHCVHTARVVIVVKELIRILCRVSNVLLGVFLDV